MNNSCVIASWVQMSIAWGALEVLREIRWAWAPTSHCPWGGVAVVCILIFITGLCLGATISACVFSTTCRRVFLLIAQVLVQPVPNPPVNMRDRLAEYRLHRS